MPGHLMVSALHKQAFASATRHQLIAFLQVAAWTNRTAVLPYARFGEPAFVGLPEQGFAPLDRYFDPSWIKQRWPCLRTTTYDHYVSSSPIVVLQLGLPPQPKAGGHTDVIRRTNCGKRSRPLMQLKPEAFACADLRALASATTVLGDGNPEWREKTLLISNWNQKLVGVGDASSPLFSDAFVNRGGCHRGPKLPTAWPPLASRWEERAAAFAQAKGLYNFSCVHFRAEKLASAMSGREKRDQWTTTNGEWRSKSMEKCLSDAAKIVTGSSKVLLMTDMDPLRGSPSNQGSAHFKEWRGRGDRLLRQALPRALNYCSEPESGADLPAECAIVEAALCRRSNAVFRFGSGTFSEFLVGDGPDAPRSKQYLNCSHIARDASSHQQHRRKQNLQSGRSS